MKIIEIRWNPGGRSIDSPSPDDVGWWSWGVRARGLATQWGYGLVFNNGVLVLRLCTVVTTSKVDWGKPQPELDAIRQLALLRYNIREQR